LTWWFPHVHSWPSFSHSPPAVSPSCLICWEFGMQLELPWLCWLRTHTKWTVDSKASSVNKHFLAVWGPQNQAEKQWLQ
jgi:hypothetical protein